MGFVSAVFRIIVGIIFGGLSGAALSPLFASFANSGPTGFFIAFGITVLLCGFAPNVRRAFGRGFLLLGGSVFILPLSTMILSGVALNETVEAAAEADKGLAVIGGGLAGGLMTGVAGIFGFFVGGVLLLFGLILSLGGQREVIIVQDKTHK